MILTLLNELYIDPHVCLQVGSTFRVTWCENSPMDPRNPPLSWNLRLMSSRLFTSVLKIQMKIKGENSWRWHISCHLLWLLCVIVFNCTDLYRKTHVVVIHYSWLPTLDSSTVRDSHLSHGDTSTSVLGRKCSCLSIIYLQTQSLWFPSFISCYPTNITLTVHREATLVPLADGLFWRRGVECSWLPLKATGP